MHTHVFATKTPPVCAAPPLCNFSKGKRRNKIDTMRDDIAALQSMRDVCEAQVAALVRTEQAYAGSVAKIGVKKKEAVFLDMGRLAQRYSLEVMTSCVCMCMYVCVYFIILFIHLNVFTHNVHGVFVSVQMKVVEDSLSVCVTDIKNLNRQIYFIDQDVKRKRGLIRQALAKSEADGRHKQYTATMIKKIDAEVRQ